MLPPRDPMPRPPPAPKRRGGLLRPRDLRIWLVAPTGAVIAQRTVPATARGYAAALLFAAEFAPGARLWAIEGAGHYGAGLARHLTARDEMVHESARSSRAERRLHGKDLPKP